MPVSEAERVVVTGIGLVTPVGADRESSWRAIRAGQSATRWLTPDDLGHVPPSCLDAFGEREWVGAPAARSAAGADEDARIQAPEDLSITLARRAAREALTDAGLSSESGGLSGQFDPFRCGTVIGTSKGGLASFSRMLQADRSGETGSDAADLWQQFLPHTAAQVVAAETGSRGPLLTPVAACATGLFSILRAAELLQEGSCDIVLAGSTDASLVLPVLASFRRMGVQARGGDDPAEACRPFDARRSGFVVGEGAAVMVLERAAAAAQRGADSYGELIGSATANDPTGTTQLDSAATGLTHLIRTTLDRAGTAPASLDYACLHGTGTVVNDLCETRALKSALGSHAKQVPCSSLKGGLGHLLGAAGSVETAVMLLALRDGTVPPTVNLNHPDPQCDLDYIPGNARSLPIRTAMKLSLGFGGHLAAALFRRGDRGAR